MSEDTDKTGSSVPIPGYAGHADARARRLSDQQVRAWVGEMLADLRDRIPLDGYRDRFEALLMRCEFGDQHVVKAIEDNRFAEPDLVELVEACDRKLIAAANLGRETRPDGLGALIEALETAFNERSEKIEARLKR
jgi:hypothetical protein